MLLTSVRSAVLDELVLELNRQLQVPVRRVSPGDDPLPGDIVILAGDDAVRAWRGEQTSVAIWSRRETIDENLDRLSSAVYTEPPLLRQLSLAE
ncbi:MAG: hypothetical protein VW258_01655, partial [Thalassolituus sp.]